VSDPGAFGARRHPFVALAAKISAVFATLLLVVMLTGLALGGAWAGEADVVVQAPGETVFDLLASPRRWDEWTPWPEVAFTYEGPPSGAGASRSWNDPRMGAGTFTVTEANRPSQVRYVVELGGGAPPTRGTFTLEPSDGGTRVTWREEGDFGRSPMMGWAALSLRRKHGPQLGERLKGLVAAAEAEGYPRPRAWVR
jgi:uncharacterized protein YndB with AHSA1/START domain